MFEPGWLRASFSRCLWDGCARPEGEEFCSDGCRETYDEWLAARRKFYATTIEFPEGHLETDEEAIPVRKRRRSTTRRIITGRTDR